MRARQVQNLSCDKAVVTQDEEVVRTWTRAEQWDATNENMQKTD